jgi:glycosyltransferase involved in cell wall biosynthesis
MTPIVSVIILTYNHSNYIAQAIQSVLEQKADFDFEILIGDDCSTDGTCEIVNSFISKYPNLLKAIRSDHNVGAIRNEKRLIDASKGKYIAFLEGDDYWTDTLKLQKQVDFLEANPEYGLVHGDVNHFYENTKKTEFNVNKSSKNIKKDGDVFFEILKPNPLFIKTATVCFRKNLIKHFDYELAIKEKWPLTDLPLWLDISFHSKVHYIDETLAEYRLLDESASRFNSPKKKYQFHKDLIKIKKYYIEKYNCNISIKKKLEENFYRNLIKIAFNLNSVIIAQDAVNFLKKNNYKIGIKERIMLLATKNKHFKKIIKKIKS